MEKYIYWLNEIHQFDIARVGGKAANLGDLARELNVPPGFCLSSAAYTNNIIHSGVHQEITAMLAGADFGNMSALEALSERISLLIERTELRPDIEKAVTDAYAKLTQGKAGIRVAVRSSATAEDLAEASFAGQQETFLNIEGLHEVLNAVKRCWASLWTARAIHYRSLKGFAHHQVKMAVIIQEMVPAAVAGVMFTANPVNDSRQEIRIEAVRGLGEQLVSGDVAGDVYILRKNDVNVEIVEKNISDPVQGQMLNDYELRELAHTGLKIELFYETYQDVEWAYSQGKLYFLQTRPITTLGDEVLPEIDPGKMSKMQREVMGWVEERFPDPIFPVDGVIVKLLFMAQFEALQFYGYKIEEMDWSRVDRGIFPEFFVPPQIKPGLRRLWLYLHWQKMLKSDPAVEWANEQVYLLDMLKKLKGRDISGLPYELVLDYVTEALHHFHFFIVMRYKYFAENRVPSAVLLGFLKYLFKNKAVGIYENLLAGSENITITINRELNALAQAARSNPGVAGVILDNTPESALEKMSTVPGGEAFLQSFHEFLARYGERETTMGLGGIASLTWQDAPDIVIGIIRSILSKEPGAVAAMEEQSRQRAREAEEQVLARLSTGLISIFPLKGLFRKILKQARSFTAFRENSHYDVTRSLHVFRILFNEVGQRLVKLGFLQDASDVVYLSYFEIKDIILTVYHGMEEVNVKALRLKINTRKAEQERRIKRWQMRKAVFDESGALKGIPACQGIITGPARIVRSPRDFHRVEEGDILIAPYTNPAWTPLFSTAAGLVVETGGAASHAAIIAREYGIPAVMGVSQATELLQDGEVITVNGQTGAIYREQLNSEQ